MINMVRSPNESDSEISGDRERSSSVDSVCDDPNDEGYSRKRRDSLILPLPPGALPPRKRAKTAIEKEQRRVERILRNRQAAQSSREKKRKQLEELESVNMHLQNENKLMAEQLGRAESENESLKKKLNDVAAELAKVKTFMEGFKFNCDQYLHEDTGSGKGIKNEPEISNTSVAITGSNILGSVSPLQLATNSPKSQDFVCDDTMQSSPISQVLRDSETMPAYSVPDAGNIVALKSMHHPAAMMSLDLQRLLRNPLCFGPWIMRLAWTLLITAAISGKMISTVYLSRLPTRLHSSLDLSRSPVIAQVRSQKMILSPSSKRSSLIRKLKHLIGTQLSTPVLSQQITSKVTKKRRSLLKKIRKTSLLLLQTSQHMTPQMHPRSSHQSSQNFQIHKQLQSIFQLSSQRSSQVRHLALAGRSPCPAVATGLDEQWKSGCSNSLSSEFMSYMSRLDTKLDEFIGAGEDSSEINLDSRDRDNSGNHFDNNGENGLNMNKNDLNRLLGLVETVNRTLAKSRSHLQD
ncbi:hypothetical protein V1511DRAFT_494884 [Dipodascopsis uninucleata]